jgi:hypothetical protein
MFLGLNTELIVNCHVVTWSLNAKIANPIIVSFPIEVVDHLPRTKATPQMMRHNKTVLFDVAVLFRHGVKEIVRVQANHNISFSSVELAFTSQLL